MILTERRLPGDYGHRHGIPKGILNTAAAMLGPGEAEGAYAAADEALQAAPRQNRLKMCSQSKRFQIKNLVGDLYKGAKADAPIALVARQRDQERARHWIATAADSTPKGSRIYISPNPLA